MMADARDEEEKSWNLASVMFHKPGYRLSPAHLVTRVAFSMSPE
eukprot:CAMPEP_0204504556 /NCGR_PEP_ID=MMETSP0471-20130131/105745_1 /ASSEMBLY_ACC=CAM_ASM_000602 /TAXON_ID=2969 /ORGANISM="Oxyrrhis marina" /LENGTH=43 /DNA_ID= /DNA_START= /DNA_END= /DNA_ORIENTATION=